MKRILLAAILVVAGIFTAKADIIVATPMRLIVSNVDAFPKYKFSMVTDNGGNAKTEILRNGKMYTLRGTVRLTVQDDSAKPTVWATVVDRAPHGSDIALSIKKVHHTDKGIEVLYEKEATYGRPDQPSQLIPATSAVWPNFFLAGIGSCGLVLLASMGRRSR